MTAAVFFDEPPLAEFACDRCWVTWRPDSTGRRRIFQRVRSGAVVPASTNQPNTWRRRDAAEILASDLRAACEKTGIGVVSHRRPSGAHVCQIDLDAAMDPATSDLKPWAQAIAEHFPSYTEVSPSGRGAHIIMLVAACDVPAVEELLRKRKKVRAGRKWFRPAAPGEKAEGIEFIWRGYLAFTGRRIQSQPRAVARAPVDTLRWLFCFAEEFKGGCATERGTPATPPVAGEQRSRRFIYLARRVHEWTISDNDAQFQVRAEFASNATPSRAGQSEAWAAPSRLKRLPGSRRGSKRSSKTAYTALAALKNAGVADPTQRFTEVAPAVAPLNGQPSRATVFSMPAWYDKPDWKPTRERPHPRFVRHALDAWDHARKTLPPRAFRLWVHLLSGLALDGREPAAEFTPSPSRLAQTFRCKPERVVAMLDHIADAGLFVVIEPRCRLIRRPARYRRAAGA